MSNPNNIKLIVIHCSATQIDRDYTVDQLRIDHKAKGYRDVGYNLYIRKDGTVYWGRNIGEVLAHAKGYNKNAIAICYEGGLDEYGYPADTRTTQQKQALINCVLFFKTLYPHAAVIGHRDLSPDLNDDGKITPNEYMKECPCFDVKSEYFK